MKSRLGRVGASVSYVCQGCAGEQGGAPVSRRIVLGGLAGLAAGAGWRGATAQSSGLAFTYPMGEPGQPLGDGFIIRHGYACENTIVQPGWLHTAEDWYRVNDIETGDAPVYATAAGEVVFAGYDYPGLVVIVQHAPDLYSLYGHLNFEAAVAAGDQVVAGQLIGTVLTQIGRRVPSHLHFELRNFLINPLVNGDTPSYGVTCGVQCPPGPGYWPLNAPEHPTALGWRNPTHVINSGAFVPAVPPGTEVVVSGMAGEALSLWTAPGAEPGATLPETIAVAPGDRFPLHAVVVGPGASEETSAEGYLLWYEITAGPGLRGWVQVAVPSTHDTGADGRPSSVLLTLLPGVIAE